MLTFTNILIDENVIIDIKIVMAYKLTMSNEICNLFCSHLLKYTLLKDHHGIKYTLYKGFSLDKGCVHYIFASLVFNSETDHL